MFTGLGCGRRRKTTCEAEMVLASMTSRASDVRRPDTAVLDASIPALRTSLAVTTGGTESMAIRTACRNRQHPAFAQPQPKTLTLTHQVQVLCFYHRVMAIFWLSPRSQFTVNSP